MTTPIRDVIASLDTSFDDLRQARSLKAIHRTLDAVAPATTGATTTTVAWPVAICTAVAGAFVMWLAMRDAPVNYKAQVAAPAKQVVIAPGEPAAAEPATPPDLTIVQVPVRTPEPVAKRAVPRAATTARASVDVRPSKVEADELYRRAESALAVSDRASARDNLERLLVDFPASPLMDAARYDLALIAVAEHDDARAVLQLDELVASGRDSNIVAAARRLRHVVMRDL